LAICLVHASTPQLTVLLLIFLGVRLSTHPRHCPAPPPTSRPDEHILLILAKSKCAFVLRFLLFQRQTCVVWDLVARARRVAAIKSQVSALDRFSVINVTHRHQQVPWNLNRKETFKSSASQPESPSLSKRTDVDVTTARLTHAFGTEETIVATHNNPRGLFPSRSRS
jgi:hypothetical protein